MASFAFSFGVARVTGGERPCPRREIARAAASQMWPPALEMVSSSLRALCVWKVMKTYPVVSWGAVSRARSASLAFSIFSLISLMICSISFIFRVDPCFDATAFWVWSSSMRTRMAARLLRTRCSLEHADATSTATRSASLMPSACRSCRIPASSACASEPTLSERLSSSCSV